MGGCDPYGGVRNHGVDVSSRSTTPGYVMGMLRIPQICCTPEGVQWEELRSLRLAVEAGADALHELHDLRQPEGIGSQEVADAGQ